MTAPDLRSEQLQPHAHSQMEVPDAHQQAAHEKVGLTQQLFLSS